MAKKKDKTFECAMQGCGMMVKWPEEYVKGGRPVNPDDTPHVCGEEPKPCPATTADDAPLRERLYANNQGKMTVSKIIIERSASVSYEKTVQVQQFEPEKKGHWDSMKLGVEVDVDTYDIQTIGNITKDYAALLKKQIYDELGL